MRTAPSIVLLCLVCSCTDEGRRSFDEGAKALERGDWNLCIEENSNAIRIDRQNWQAYVNRAICYLESGKALAALDDATAAIKIESTIPGNYLIRAGALDALGRTKEAEADLEHALALAPDNANVWLGCAQHDVRTKAYAHALAAVDSALLHDPSNEAAISMKGSVLILKHDYSSALEWLKDRLTQPGPNNAINVTNMGFAESQLGLFEEARTHLKLALTLDSLSSPAWNNLGFVNFKLGYIEDGRTMIDRAISLDPANSYAHYNRGLIALALADTQDACGRFRNATGLGFARDHGVHADSLIDLYCGRTKHLVGS